MEQAQLEPSGITKSNEPTLADALSQLKTAQKTLLRVVARTWNDQERERGGVMELLGGLDKLIYNLQYR